MSETVRSHSHLSKNKVMSLPGGKYGSFSLFWSSLALNYLPFLESIFANILLQIDIIKLMYRQ